MRALYHWVLYLGGFVLLGLALVTLILLIFPQRFIQLTGQDSVTQPAPDNLLELRASYSQAVDRAAPAVVNNYVNNYVQERPISILSDPQSGNFSGMGTRPRLVNRKKLGSGVVFSADGYIMTNFHVIEDADDINVALWDGRVTKASVIGADPDTDLAVLKIDMDQIPTIEFAGNDEIRVGDVVLAIGNTLGLGKTVTQGIVSATGRSDLDISIYENFIQTDAAINQGNSGGALVNSRGQLIGINTAMIGRGRNAEGIGFAIPMETAEIVLSEIIDKGFVTRGWLGIDMKDGRTYYPQFARSADNKGGIVVMSVYRDSPAHSVGIQPGDYITAINQQALTGINQFYRDIAILEPGQEVELEVWREGRPFTVKTRLIQRPDVSTPSA